MLKTKIISLLVIILITCWNINANAYPGVVIPPNHNGYTQIWGYDPTDGLLHPVQVDANGNVQIGSSGLTIGAVNQGTHGSDPWEMALYVGGTPLAFGTATAANSLPVTLPTSVIATLTPPTSVGITPGAVTYTSNNSTITVGGTSQQITATNANRHVLIFFNNNALGGDVEYLNFGAAATTNDIPIYPGGGWQSDPQTCPSGSINVLGATTGDKFSEKEN